MARFYRMLIAPTLFGEWALIREWGLIGKSGKVRADRYPNAGAALLAMQELDTRINWLSNVALRGVKAVSASSSA